MNSLRFSWPTGFPRLLSSPKECPVCTSIGFPEAELPKPLDRTLSLFALHPIRCVNCWRRYYGFSMTNKAST